MSRANHFGSCYDCLLVKQMHGFNFNRSCGGGGNEGGNLQEADHYSTRYLTSSFTRGDDAYYAAARLDASSPATRHWAGPPGPDFATPSAPTDHLFANLKRPSSESLYHPSLFGASCPYGQTQAWLSANPLVKRPRFDSSSRLPIYPQRPGEKDCSHYMLTGTCKFGDICIFDHPIWVPQGGVPDWQEVQLISPEVLPQRPGEPDCPFFLKTRRCKFGGKCKFNHPKEETNPVAAVHVDSAALPERPAEPTCAFYMKTGKCKFGNTCKFHHPKDVEVSGALQENISPEAGKLPNDEPSGDLKPVTPALMHNTKGLPVRLGEVDCPFYLKTGSCKYGQSCRFNHPDRYAINPPAAAISAAVVPPPAPHFGAGFVSPAASVFQNFNPRSTQTMLGLAAAVYPQRPGEAECNFYMKTGECKFGQSCRFHHPADRRAGAKEVVAQNVSGLPRREGAIHCPYYMKTGVCKYGVACKFDHPPPAEVMLITTTKGSSSPPAGAAAV